MNEQWPRPERYWESGPQTGPQAPIRGGPALGHPGPATGAQPVYAGPPHAVPAFYGSTPQPPSGPPARVGSAVAALVFAVLTLVFPVLFWFIGVIPLVLLVNIPGIAFGVIALTRTHDPPEVERFMRYTWASTIIYVALMVVLLVGIVALLLSI